MIDVPKQNLTEEVIIETRRSNRSRTVHRIDSDSDQEMEQAFAKKSLRSKRNGSDIDSSGSESTKGVTRSQKRAASAEGMTQGGRGLKSRKE